MSIPTASIDKALLSADAPASRPRPVAQFGQGGHEPYANSLSLGRGHLILRPESARLESVGPIHFSVLGWSAPATTGELELLRTLRGPVLDVGCGPGRMLGAARELGLAAMGVDSSAHAVRLATARGAAAIHGSIFDPIPHEGGWGSALLLDGNIGIGGNIPVLLERVASLIAPGGQVLAEAEARESLDLAYLAVLEDSAGRASAAFPWARAGGKALAVHAARAGLASVAARTVQGLVFLTLERRK
ncbi:SAM-dependent methyltransferase [Arthrobacter bambusae]|uniref:SAM-dependent methyltransferase n=1 Tax=Arthrobacter bambusae TaxID=1338426 RepID=UPI00277E484F|nr:class I SAM-dependent methyltransferase [Arthrobacter bambusae]MDQ0028513.1 SAM-dependent methyltransferase [Arthrobacter bambusae]MDQ0096693.1 SAM-dependent methyltransferase [Arthrobacter bambusae]